MNYCSFPCSIRETNNSMFSHDTKVLKPDQIKMTQSAASDTTFLGGPSYRCWRHQ